MCGIAGEVNWANPPSRDAVLRMSQSLAHRGPDANGMFADNFAALGHRRLSILDLIGGVQPMTRENVTLVFNGQVYNHHRLREELSRLGHSFSTRSDTEVVLRAYLQWGEAVAPHLEGMFAIALWDATHRKLVLLRDRMGKKPLYYHQDSHRLIFGSELKALLAHGEVTRELDRISVAQYLAVEYVPTPRSIFASIKKFPPAHLAVKDARGFRIERYWSLPREADASRTERDEAPKKLLSLLDQAVGCRLEADVPVGVFLSGGIDSSAVAALATRHSRPVKTFAVGFSESSFDESVYAQRAADALKTEHHTQMFSGQDCLNLLPEVVAGVDEPFADPSILPTLLLSRFVRNHVKVALSGDGGDELFAGYDTFLAHRAARLAARLPDRLIALLGRVVSKLPASSTNMSIDFRLKQFFRGLSGDPSLTHQAWIGSFSPSELCTILPDPWKSTGAPPVAYQQILIDVEEGRREGVRKGSIEEALRFFQTRYLADDILFKADRASMMASLEVRAPFLDTAVVEFAARLPATSKLSGFTTKAVLKKSLKDVLPKAILGRAKKGFGIPTAAWIRGPLRPLFEDLFSSSSLQRSDLVEPTVARSLLERHLRGAADFRKPLWTVAMLLLWQRQWMT